MASGTLSATVVGALIGVGSTLLSSFVTTWTRRTDEKRKLVREKLEEALLLCYEFDVWLAGLDKKKFEYDLSVVTESPVSKISIRVRSYETSLDEPVSQLMKCYQDLMELCEKYWTQDAGSGTATEPRATISDLRKNRDAAKAASDNLKRAIEEAIRGYMSSRSMGTRIKEFLGFPGPR